MPSGVTHLRAAVYVATLALLMLVLAAWSGHPSRAQAQDDGAAAPAAADNADDAGAAAGAEGDGAPSQDAAQTLGEEIFKRPETTAEWVGVGFYFVLFVFSMVAATVSLERLFNLRRSKVIPAGFTQRLNDLARNRQDNEENLRSLANSSHTAVANVLKAGLFRAGRSLQEVEKGMEDAMLREVAALRGRHRVLSVVGSVAPLVGLLGTVVGMIFAFQISSQAGLGKAELLAKGIYLALLTTAAGLTIAIPCLLFVAWFNAKVDRFMREMDESLLETMPAFIRMEKSAASVAATEASNGDDAAREEVRVPVTAK